MDAIFHRRSIRAYTERNAEEDKFTDPSCDEEKSGRTDLKNPASTL